MKRNLKVVLSFLITIALVAFVWQFVQWQHLITALREVRWTWSLLAFALFCLYQWFRTARFEILLSLPNQRWLLFNTQCTHAVLNGSLPAGLGEAAFVYLMNKIHNVNWYRGAASLLVARLVDLGLFSLLFLGIVALLYDRIPAELVAVMTAVTALLALALVGLRVMMRVRHDPDNFEGWRRKLLTQIVSFQVALREASRRHIWTSLIFYSTCMWTTMYGFFFATVLALGFELDWLIVLLVYLLIFPVNLLPVKGVGNFGTHEAAWFIALTIAGVSKTDAATLAFGSHIVMLAILAMTAIIPLSNFLYGILKGSEHHAL